MKLPSLLSLAALWSALLAPQAALAQEKIFRCPNNEYINHEPTAKERGCKLIEGGNITIIPAPKPAAVNGQARPANGAQTQAQRTAAANEQRAREADRRAILESELKKLEAKQTEQTREFNNGEPEKQGIEARNNQRYLDRVAEMKASMARTESDISSVRGELNRLPAAPKQP